VTGNSAAGGPNGTGSYTLTQAAKVGTYSLDRPVTNQLQPFIRNGSKTVTNALKAKKAGQPGKAVFAVYNAGTVTSMTSPDFKGLVFIGFDGTYNPDAVISIVRSHLKSSRLVEPGPHGGKMTCGYDTSDGTTASECVWATKTTFGIVEFLKGEKAVKQDGASTLALQVRDAVEVKG
jgi:hypothetical protein